MSMLEIKNVHKSFFTYTKPRLQAGIFHRPGARKVTSELQVLRGVDLTVEKGDVVAILGPSGSGKTTLLRCLNFLETADAGQLTFDGETFDLAQASRADIARLRKKTAFVFQSYNLFRNKTALQNVTEGLIVARRMPREQADAIGRRMLEKVGLADRADAYPSQLSGGQKQRVGIARALASNPKVLLCDEATSALDPQTTKSILNLLRDINQRLNLTIVMITHQMEVVKEICDRVAVIENGSIIEEGNMVDVFTNPQNQTTKEFVKSVDKNTLPESLKSTPVSREYFEGASLAVRLSFFSGNADKPIVSGMIKRFGVDANIISGNTDQLKDRIYGNLLIVIEGPQKALEDSLDYLNSKNLQVEVIGYVK